MDMDAYAYMTITAALEQSTISYLASINSQLSFSLTQALETIQVLQADMKALKHQLTQVTNQQRNGQQQYNN